MLSKSKYGVWHSSNIVWTIASLKMAYNCKQSVVSIEWYVCASVLLYLSVCMCSHNGYVRAAEHHCNHQHPKADEVRYVLFYEYFWYSGINQYK